MAMTTVDSLSKLYTAPQREVELNQFASLDVPLTAKEGSGPSAADDDAVAHGKSSADDGTGAQDDESKTESSGLSEPDTTDSVE